jgi:hypothetical protein
MCVAIAITSIASAQVQAKVPEPERSRMPAKPAWELDITDDLQQLKLAPADAVTAATAEAIPLAAAISREVRASGANPVADDVWWRVTFTPPAQVKDWPVVLDVDEGRVIRDIWFDGKPLPKLDLSTLGENYWNGRSCVPLPIESDGRAVTLVLRVRPIDALYDTAFGRLRLRPATLSEITRVDRPANDEVKVSNLSSRDLDVVVHAICEDFFGVELGRSDSPLHLPAGATLAAPAKMSPGAYKLRVYLTAGDRASFDHWQLSDGERNVRTRDHVIRLSSEWDYAPHTVPAAHITAGSSTPKDGWKPVKLPHVVEATKATTHAAWYRQRVTVPADWSGDRLQLFMQSVQHKVSVFVNGKCVAEKFSWELPDAIDLPAELNAGDTFELALGVTDYTVGLRADIARPAPGTVDLPARATAAPSMDRALGIRSVPELVGVPTQRVDWCGITPTLKGSEKSLAAKIELVNESGKPANVTLRARVFARGTPVLTLLEKPITLAPGRSEQSASNAFPNARLWSPEDPFLYELRLELVDASGESIDVRRERFGFRTFAIDGDHFTLNGERITLLGGSHLLLQSRQWPVVPTPYRFIRHFINEDSGFLLGRIVERLADEMGILLKAETPQVNAMHSDPIAFHDEVFWRRHASYFRAAWRLHVNDPANVMWDVGNELFYPGTGEAQRMGRFLREVHAMDPTRYATTGGSLPLPDPADLVDLHGHGEWRNRNDFYMHHPEQRPAYMQSGRFLRKPDGDTGKWVTLPKKPAEDEMLDLGGRPILFSEGFYYENAAVPELLGNAAYVRLPDMPEGFPRDHAQHFVPMLAIRSLGLQNMRDAGAASMMIHVDRGVGRNASPLVSFNRDRLTRFRSGEKFRATFTVHHDLATTSTVYARYAIYDGKSLLGEQSWKQSMKQGSTAEVPVELPLPAVDADRTLRLSIETWTEGGANYYRDDQVVTVFAPAKFTKPAGRPIVRFDPKDVLASSADAFAASVPSIDAWDSASQALVIAPDALVGVDSAQLATLRTRVLAGARVVVLDHDSIPNFLPRLLVQRDRMINTAGVVAPGNDLLRGLTPADLRNWRTKFGDQIVARKPVELPSTGNTDVFLDTNRTSPLLALHEGAGEVLFSQLFLSAALGIDPAADRMMQNILDWAAQPRSSVKEATLIVADDPSPFAQHVRTRFGVDGDLVSSPSDEDIARATRILVQGTLLPRLAAQKDQLRAALDRGATIFVQDLDDASAAALSSIVGSEVRVKPFAMDHGYLVSTDPLVAGLHHGALWWKGDTNKPTDIPLQPADDQPGHVAIEGANFVALTRPAFLGTISVGKGRVVISTFRTIDRPTWMSTRIGSTLLSNAGFRLVSGGLSKKVDDSELYTYAPIDLSAKFNWPIVDDPAGKRGWTRAGDNNDLREFPRGRTALRGGVVYSFLDPADAQANRVIALAGTKEKGVLPSEMLDIPVNRKADRLYFLHNSAWGTPGFTYRVWYLEDRKAWIFGKPDPFVDVVVKPAEHIQDWFFASDVDRGDLFLPGATVAWRGPTPYSKAMGREVGVYQMVWDNPSPEKTIEKIDILSPGTVGTGQAFVFGITAADRKAVTGGAIEQAYPKLDAKRIVQRHITDAYELGILDNGSAVVASRSGKPLVKLEDWYLQGQTGQPGQPPEFHYLGSQEGTAAKVQRDGEAFVIEQTTDRLEWKVRLVPKASSFRVEYSARVLQATPPDMKVYFRLGLGLGAPLNAEHTPPGEWPVVLPTENGTLTLKANEELHKWYGAPGYAIDEQGLRFGITNGEPLAANAKAEGWLEVQLP